MFVFTPNQEPVVLSWDKDIEVLDGTTFNIAQFLAEEGIPLSENNE